MFVTVPWAGLVLTTVADGTVFLPALWAEVLVNCLVNVVFIHFSFILFGLFETLGSQGKTFIVQSTEGRKYLLHEKMTGRGGSWLV